ncbi:MAG TPA: aminotransferase class V-fold PLP-dependent enzyme [Nocardioidaceae bacterium]|nr:aminotransferase class V-fold PLP-dependent enzyme [Nocardioidaceae bacterium]
MTWWVAEFDADCVYLDTASLGLPPRRTTEALRTELDVWRLGQRHAPDYDEYVGASRNSFASMVGVDPSCVAIGPQASVYVGLVAASLPADSVVLAPEGEFTSVTFPFIARGLEVREVPLDALANAIDESVDLVAYSAVQSADGALADLAAIEEACTRTGARQLVDLTQGAGWLPVDAARFDYSVTAAYKWLLSPRGSCFFTAKAELLDEIVPMAAGWYAGPNPWTSIYGTPLRLAEDARRFDISPAWHSWVGTAASLEFLAMIGTPARHEHTVGLANAFRTGVGLQTGAAPIVSVETRDGVEKALADHRIRAASRAGRLRLSFHVNNSAADVEVAVEALAPFVVVPPGP